MARMTTWSGSGANAYWVNWWPGYPKYVPWWEPPPVLTNTANGGYPVASIGGGAVAPVPQAGPAAAAATATAEPKIETFVSCDVAAGACLSAFETQANLCVWHGKVARGERPITSDTLRAAILRALPARTKKFRTEALDVGLRWADPSGVTFTVEGLRTE